MKTHRYPGSLDLTLRVIGKQWGKEPILALTNCLPHEVQSRYAVGCFTSQGAFTMTLSLHREQMESQLEKEARFRQLMAHSSHDSAIDTDSMEWETEVVEFERETVSCL